VWMYINEGVGIPGEGGGSKVKAPKTSGGVERQSVIQSLGGLYVEFRLTTYTKFKNSFLIFS